MFSYRLTRLPYAILMYAHAFWEMQQISTPSPASALLVLGSLPLLFVFVIWPRLRDCDWPVWVGLLMLVPYLGALVGVSLFFRDSKVFGRKEHAAEAAAQEAVPLQIPGSLCAKCGAKIIVASEGMIRDDKVFCKNCEEVEAPPSEG